MIRKALKWIVFAFNTPSAFADSWRDWLINQAGHTLGVGALPGFLIATYAPVLAVLTHDHLGLSIAALTFQVAGVALTAALYGLWEFGQYRLRGARASDCIADWAFVMLGHFTAATLNPILAVILIAFLASGALSRAQDDTFYF